MIQGSHQRQRKPLLSQLRAYLIRHLWALSIPTATINKSSVDEFPNSSEAHVAPRTLDDILGPDVRPFLGKSWGRSVTHIPGFPGKFGALMPWPALNSILEQHHGKLVRLSQGGQTLDSRSYQNANSLRHVQTSKLLADGATLILDEAEQFYRPLRDLITNLEKLFRGHVQANLYASFTEVNGFSVHHDSQDTIILQVSGRKHWKVFYPREEHPLKNATNIPLKELRVVWEGILNDGDALHVPRGYPHLVTPLLEPTLHLTVTFTPMTGVDLLKWVVERVAEDTHARTNVPVFSELSEQQEWIDAIRKSMLSRLDGGVVERFLAANEARHERPIFALPMSVLAALTPGVPEMERSHRQ